MNKILITQASRILDLSECQVRRLADAGDIPCERNAVGRRVFDIETVRRIADERRRKRSKQKTTSNKAA